MKKSRLVRALVLLTLVGIVGASGVALYMFNKPHRNVASADADLTLSGTALVREYLDDPKAANAKYLSEEGNSLIIAVSGTIKSVSRDLAQHQVVLLQESGDPAGVSCTFDTNHEPPASILLVGQMITIKGVIRAGAGYDSDLDLYEDVILEKCVLINQK